MMGRKRKSRKRSRRKRKRNIAKVKRKNPRTGRKTYYLGHRVPDRGEPGLSSLREVEGICKKILSDYERGRLSKKEASGRFARLHNAIIPRDKSFKGKVRKAKAIVKKYWKKLSEEE